MHAVILSGGSGTRLWPLSREAYPKQFLNLNGDQSLLADTLTRALAVPGCDQVLAITNEAHRFVVAAEMQQYAGDRAGSILLEPVGRNTAPAIALAALRVMEEDPEGQMLVLPSDHAINDQAAFVAAVSEGQKAAARGSLVTFGVVPGHAHTGYGYIRAGEGQGGDPALPVREFVEKPDQATAQAYLKAGNYYWNSGMFLFRADRYLEELGLFQPDILAACRKAYDTRKGDLDFVRVDEAAFAACPDDSIDYAVMEHTAHGVVLPLDAGWSDIGSWSALWDLHAEDEAANVLVGDVITEDVSGCYIHSEGRLIAAMGLQDHVIVETGDALLVAHKNRVQDVKQLVNQLKASGREEYRLHRKVHRPWGSYEGIARADRFQVKRITVNPGARLSLQKHHHRSEHWVIVKGTAIVTRGDDEVMLTEDQSTYIPLGVVHRLTNPGVIPLEVIEVQTGSYLGEDDIVRFEDIYSRV
ncbi:MAG: mannose-1-phosphate guanylyltransferase/mannose-6-phosphate isomerase [Oleiphilaceae bacterium]|nr:mannose-1-phosphate guanylyltransferase/mannose-6-phosphate isomerase [Oleiphilaceae bacterium]